MREKHLKLEIDPSEIIEDYDNFLKEGSENKLYFPYKEISWFNQYALCEITDDDFHKENGSLSVENISEYFPFFSYDVEEGKHYFVTDGETQYFS